MIETILSTVILVIGVYFASGFLFAIGFVSRGVKQIDPAAKLASLGFKLLIIPGCMVFWPMLLVRWKFRHKMPVEYSRHRCDVSKDR